MGKFNAAALHDFLNRTYMEWYCTSCNVKINSKMVRKDKQDFQRESNNVRTYVLKVLDSLDKEIAKCSQKMRERKAVVETCKERDVPITAVIVGEVAAAYLPEKRVKPEPEREPEDLDQESDDAKEPAPEADPEADDQQDLDFCGSMNAALEHALREFDPPNVVVLAWLTNKTLQFK